MIDRSKLTPDQVAQLDQYEASQKQIEELKNVAAVIEHLVITLEKGQDKDEKSDQQFGAVLVSIREQLMSLNSKEAPEMPDTAKPVVDSLKRLEKALTDSIKSIDVKPQVSVTAPNVNVEPKVDLSGVEKVLKTVPQAFEKAIKSIPEISIPDDIDYTDKLDEMLVWLQNIDTASRLKPQFPVSQLNTIATSTAIPSTVLAGEKVISSTGTPEALASSTTCTYALVQAKPENTSNCFVGNNSTQKVELEPGQAWSFSIDNLSKIFIKVGTDNDGVNYTAG